jgi:hypothetical protein
MSLVSRLVSGPKVITYSCSKKEKVVCRQLTWKSVGEIIRLLYVEDAGGNSRRIFYELSEE